MAFIKQEALEKAREIKVKADEEFAIEKARTRLVFTEQMRPNLACVGEAGETGAAGDRRPVREEEEECGGGTEDVCICATHLSASLTLPPSVRSPL